MSRKNPSELDFYIEDLKSRFKGLKNRGIYVLDSDDSIECNFLIEFIAREVINDVPNIWFMTTENNAKLIKTERNNPNRTDCLDEKTGDFYPLRDLNDRLFIRLLRKYGLPYDIIKK